MKLNYKRTILVGFAFFLICAFWQAYDTIIPKILTDKFGMSQTWSGVIMALDNVLALFLLPIFGAISDKCKSKRGKRTPFIIIGTMVACCAVLLLAFADSMQTAKMAQVDPFRDKDAALVTLYEADPVIKAQPDKPVTEKLSKLIDKKDFAAIKTTESTGEITSDYRTFVEPALKAAEGRADLGDLDDLKTKVADGEEKARNTLYDTDPVITATPKKQVESQLHNFISKEDFRKITLMEDGKTTDDFDTYVLTARESYAAGTVKSSPAVLIMFIVVLLILLVAMGVFRSPAVALMPDVTPKPLRSKGNAIINLMGALGGILILVLGIILGTGKVENTVMGFAVFFMIVTAIMIISLLIFVLTVKEPLWAKEAEETYERYYPEETEREEDTSRKLTKGEKISLILILASVALWFMGYNAVSSKYSVYAGSVLGKDYNLTLMIAQGAAILSYIPVGFLSSKIGRRKAILIGIGMLTTAFTAAAFVTKNSPDWLMTAMFVVAGIGWATINVNSFPMVVELATGSKTGRYTGFYYTASMAAQTVTPILSGFFLDINMRTLFPYALIFTGLSFVTMFFVKHGDSKPVKKSALEALGGPEDG